MDGWRNERERGGDIGRGTEIVKRDEQSSRKPERDSLNREKKLQLCQKIEFDHIPNIDRRP